MGGDGWSVGGGGVVVGWDECGGGGGGGGGVLIRLPLMMKVIVCECARLCVVERLCDFDCECVCVYECVCVCVRVFESSPPCVKSLCLIRDRT